MRPLSVLWKALNSSLTPFRPNIQEINKPNAIFPEKGITVACHAAYHLDPISIQKMCRIAKNDIAFLFMKFLLSCTRRKIPVGLQKILKKSPHIDTRPQRIRIERADVALKGRKRKRIDNRF
jgi:hypothetical protein